MFATVSFQPTTTTFRSPTAWAFGYATVTCWVGACGVAAATWTKLIAGAVGTATVVVKLAVTLCAWLSVTLQPAVPEQAPLQPVKVEPLAGVAESVITLPAVKLAVHVLPHAMPAGVLVTLPLPVPDLVTVSG